MLSIIIITKDREIELLKSMQSCEKAISINHEYVIIDNNPKSNTFDFLNTSFDQKLNITYKKNNSNLGVSESRNLGYSLAKGDILYFIDDDAFIINDDLILDKAYYLMSTNRIASMATDIYDTKRKQKLVSVIYHDRKINKKFVHTYIGCSHFINKSLLNREYLYDSELFYGSEELYFSFNLKINNLDIYLFDDMFVVHSPSKNNRNSDYSNKFNSHINTAIIKCLFLPYTLKFISYIFFILRIFRFNNFNLKLVFNTIKIYHTRIKKFKKTNKLSFFKSLSLISKYGLFSIL